MNNLKTNQTPMRYKNNLTRKRTLIVCSMFLLGLYSYSKEASNEMPNIILCMADDQGWFDTGYNGHPYVKTPVLDEMAKKGVRFNMFYAATPVCAPTRASVLTGRHSDRSGTFNWNYSIRPEEITIAHLLKEAGYSTGHFGKWHLGPVKSGSPVNPGAMGFDYWLSHDNFFGYNPPLSENGAPWKEFKGESSEILVERAIEWIKENENKKKPFLAVIWFGSPHDPFSASDLDYGLYFPHVLQKTKNPMIPHYLGEITALDRAVGKLRQFLEVEEIKDNTLLWYCSDNGIPPEVVIDGGPLRGAKGMVYENGIRVPGLIEWPAKFPKPMEIDVPSVTSDILPTILDFLSIELPDRPLDGISLKPILEGKIAQRMEPICFWYNDFRNEEKYNLEWYLDKSLLFGNVPTHKSNVELDPDGLPGAIRTGGIQFQNFVDVSALRKDFPGIAAIRDNRFKLVEPKPGKFELYDILKDPGEQIDLVSEHPGITQKLVEQLRQWQSEVELSMTGVDYK